MYTYVYNKYRFFEVSESREKILATDSTLQRRIYGEKLKRRIYMADIELYEELQE